MRRAALSVVANIVEGSKRKTAADRKHFLVMAETSLEELKYYILLSYELGYITKPKGEQLTEQAREIGKMLTGLSNSIN
jgi:four helix bundle protein